MSKKRWLILYLILAVGLLLATLFMVIRIDPFFHYHEPLPELYYTLDNERSQNHGILKNFDYDCVTIGTSMVANTKTSEIDELFHTNAVKTQFSGASFYETEQNLELAFETHKPELVIRCLDMQFFRDQPDYMRIDMGEYPEYLYDDNPWNDVKYIYNRDVVFGRCLPMLFEAAAGREGGMTSFDEYGNWMEGAEFGAKVVLKDFSEFGLAPYSPGLTGPEQVVVEANVRYNATDIVEAHPETTFYYYIAPYSAVWWGERFISGEFFKALEAERIVIESILPYENVRLFSFNMNTDLTTDLNNYKDAMHYAEWVNSDITRWMSEGKYEITWDNYEDYLKAEQDFYGTFPYNSLFLQ